MIKNGLLQVNELEGVKVSIDLIPKENKTSRPQNKMDPKYITVHNTGNASKGADAEMHTKYVDTAKGYISWHLTVDDKAIIQELPFLENGWHAGDGNGPGNRSSIGIEICEHSGIDWPRAKLNSIAIISVLMDKYNIPLENVVPHQRWSGKYCPHIILKAGWKNFVKEIEEYRERKLVPQWQRDALKGLVDKGVINTPGYWETKLAEPITVGEVMAIINKL